METPALLSSLSFKVRRSQPELVPPAIHTPHEFKQLSDIDDQQGFRFHVPLIQFYPHNPTMPAIGPAKLIKQAISKVLVFYYPFAGRLREGPGRKLFVECTGQGILFIEADADVALEQFGNVLQPPFPCFEELLYDVPGSERILNSPLLLIQVTRLMCGGFIFAIRVNHTMCDAFGIVQFMTAISEMVAGATSPSVLPVWQRAILNARDPPTVTHSHREFNDVANKGTIIPQGDITLSSFFFGPTEISTLRKNLPNHLRQSSSFEILTAFIWRHRTIALELNPEEEVRVCCIVNARSVKFNPPLPVGYYGNAFAYPAAVTTAEKLCQNPLGYALDLVKKAKAEMTEEYIKSVADFLVVNGRPLYTQKGMFIVSDLRQSKLDEIDYGWGKPIYSGTAIAFPVISFYMASKNSNGENGRVVPLCLPPSAMERFKLEFKSLFKEDEEQLAKAKRNDPRFIKSAL